METILKFLAVFSSGIFTGAAFYLTTVEHPARMSLGVEAALEEFRPSYKRAEPQQAALRERALQNGHGCTPCGQS
jgi:hypothetical protein